MELRNQSGSWHDIHHSYAFGGDGSECTCNFGGSIAVNALPRVDNDANMRLSTHTTDGSTGTFVIPKSG